ncbi:MAG: histidine kinase [Anaerolineae bacterium]
MDTTNTLPATQTVRYWLVLGINTLGLIIVLALMLFLQSGNSLVLPALTGLAVNFTLLVCLSVPSMTNAVPLVALIGSALITGSLTAAGGGHGVILLTASGIGVLGALVQSSTGTTLLHVIIVIASALMGVLLQAGSADVLNTPEMASAFPLLLVIGAASIFVMSLIDRQTTAMHREIDEAGRQRSAQLDNMRERIRTMYDISYTMGSTLKYEKVLETALEAGRVGLRLSGAGTDAELIAAVLLFHADDNALHVVSGRRLTRGDTLRIIPGKEGIVGDALREAVPVFGSNGKDDPELGYFVALQYCKSVVCVPLRAVYDNFGVLVYGSERPNAFNDEHSELLTAIGVQATIALQNAVLYQNLMEEKERIIEIEDDARRKLASDLHDGPTQNIAAMAMRVNYIVKLLDKRPENVAEELHKLEDLARRTSKEIRQVLFTWKPLVLESHGLAAALNQLAEKVNETHGQRVQVRVTGDVAYMVDRKQQVVIFHIVEEALNNARKHANASLVSVSMFRQNDVAILQVMDNGQGFDLTNVGAQGGGRNSLGMINMRERAELIEGTFNVESEPGKGTLITVVVPLKDKAADKQSANGTDEVPIVNPRRAPRKSMTKLALAAEARIEKMSSSNRETLQ